MNEIKHAVTEADIESARMLFREYETSLGFSLCFQNFEDELANLPGKYSPPDGRLYLAYVDGELAGCIALKKIDNEICEMKRLFLRENARGRGLGKQLIEKLIEKARTIGYRKMRLDTFPSEMGKAISLYESHGFYPTVPYYQNPPDGVLFMEKLLK